jgi:uncharacterized protein YcbX
MRGESCDELHFEARGVAGDRTFGVFDLGSQTVLSAKREGRLLNATARLSPGELVVTMPDGQELGQGEALDERLSSWLERPVKLVEAATFGAATYESPQDYESDESELVQWEGPNGSFVDESPLHLLTTGDLDMLALERPDLQWDVHRFRPNVLVNAANGYFGSLEPGHRVRLGDAEVEIQKGCSRCVMTTRPQPGSLERQLDILRHVSSEHNSVVGVRAIVVEAGKVRVGDRVSISH